MASQNELLSTKIVLNTRFNTRMRLLFNVKPFVLFSAMDGTDSGF